MTLELPAIDLYTTQYGKFFLPKDTNDPLVNSIKNGIIWDEFIVNEIKTRTTSNSVILDLGSNFGQMTLLFSNLVKDGGMVVSIESNPWIYYALSKTISINFCKNVRLINSAVWDISDVDISLDFDNCVKYASYGSYGVLPSGNNKNFTVKSITVDSLNLQKVDFIKIDVQGSDLRAMIGAKDTIKRCSPVIIFEYEESLDEIFSTNWNEYEKFIEEIGYTIEKKLDSVNYVIVPNS